MASLEELDRAAEQAVEYYNNQYYEKAQTLFSSLILSACFYADADEEQSHVDRIVRMLEARLTTEVTERDQIRKHVEMILTGMSEPSDRFAGFSLLLRQYN